MDLDTAGGIPHLERSTPRTATGERRTPNTCGLPWRASQERFPRLCSALKLRCCGLVVLTCLLLLGCDKAEKLEEAQKREREQSAARVLARVNGEALTVAQFEQVVTSMPPFLRQAVQGQTGTMRIFGEMMNFELLRQAADRAGLANDAKVQLHTRQVLVDELRRELAKGLKLEPPSLEQAELRLRQDPERWRSPERLSVDLLFSRSLERTRILRTAFFVLRSASLTRSKADELFFSFARRFTEEVGTQSTLGPFSEAEARKALPSELVDALFAAHSIGLLPILEVPGGYYLVYLRERIEAAPLPASELRGILAAEALQAATEEAWQRLRREVMATAQIEVLDPKLSAALNPTDSRAP